VELPHALERKYRNATREWGWQWLRRDLDHLIAQWLQILALQQGAAAAAGVRMVLDTSTSRSIGSSSGAAPGLPCCPPRMGHCLYADRAA